MRKRRAKVSITTFFSSCADNGYVSAEREFVDACVFLPLHERETDRQIEVWRALRGNPTIPALFKESPAAYYRQLMLQCLEKQPDGGMRYNDDVWRIVVAIVRRYGMDVIRMEGMNKYRLEMKPSDIRRTESYLHPLAKKRNKAVRIELQYLESLGSFICAAIRQWQQEALSGDANQRRNAVKWLKSTFGALIPDLRGKRQNKLVGSRYDVMEYYYKELFRLNHVKNALRSSGGPRNHSLKVKAASENYGLPIDTIRSLWCLDGDDKPTGRPLEVTQMARMLTGQHFKITEHAVKNLLSL